MYAIRITGVHIILFDTGSNCMLDNTEYQKVCPQFKKSIAKVTDIDGSKLNVSIRLEEPILNFVGSLSEVQLKFISSSNEQLITWSASDLDSNITKTIRLKKNNWYITIFEAFVDKLSPDLDKTTKPVNNQCMGKFFANFWECSNGETILTTDICNGAKDCSDGSDEATLLCDYSCQTTTKGKFTL